jgi:hypothetical protein
MRMWLMGVAGVVAAGAVVWGASPPQIGIGPTERLTTQPAAVPGGEGGRVTIGIGPTDVPTATASAPATAASMPALVDKRLTMQRAQTIVRGMALQSPNPYVRETAYHDRDGDWKIDLPGLTFAVKIRGAEEKVYTGKLTPTGNGWATAVFDEDAALRRAWVVPTDAVLSAEEARKCLVAMCARLSEEPVMRSLGETLKGTEVTEDVATGEWTGSATGNQENFNWRISPKKRTFAVEEGAVEVTQSLSGCFGWDKEHHWMAWPIVGGITYFGGRTQHLDYLVIPEGKGLAQGG